MNHPAQDAQKMMQSKLFTKEGATTLEAPTKKTGN